MVQLTLIQLKHVLSKQVSAVRQSWSLMLPIWHLMQQSLRLEASRVAKILGGSPTNRAACHNDPVVQGVNAYWIACHLE